MTTKSLVRCALLALPVVALLVGSGAVRAQTFAPESLARDFRIDFQTAQGAGGTVIDGYVYNQSRMGVERIMLRVTELDTAGAVVRTTRTHVLGGVRSGDRAYFRTKVPAAPGYRVQVESFQWVGCGDA